MVLSLQLYPPMSRDVRLHCGIAHIHSMTLISLSLYLQCSSCHSTAACVPFKKPTPARQVLIVENPSFVHSWLCVCVCVCMCMCVCMCVCVCTCVFVHSGASGVYPQGSSGAEDILTGTYVTLFTNHSLSPSYHTHTHVLYELPIPRGIPTNLCHIRNSISVQKASLGLVLSTVVTE